MKRKAIPTILLLFFLSLFTAFGQEVTVSDARFCKGDDPAFSAPGFDDATWPVLSLEKDWTKQGIANAYGYGWYRIHVVIPSSLKKARPTRSSSTWAPSTTTTRPGSTAASRARPTGGTSPAATWLTRKA